MYLDYRKPRPPWYLTKVCGIIYLELSLNELYNGNINKMVYCHAFLRKGMQKKVSSTRKVIGIRNNTHDMCGEINCAWRISRATGRMMQNDPQKLLFQTLYLFEFIFEVFETSNGKSFNYENKDMYNRLRLKNLITSHLNMEWGITDSKEKWQKRY